MCPCHRVRNQDASHRATPLRARLSQGPPLSLPRGQGDSATPGDQPSSNPGLPCRFGTVVKPGRPWVSRGRRDPHSGTVPQASDLLAAAGSPEIPSLSLRTSYPLHTVPVPTHRWPKFPSISSITGRVGHVLYSYNCGSDVNRLLKNKKNKPKMA